MEKTEPKPIVVGVPGAAVPQRGAGEITCPKKGGVIGIGRCLQLQQEMNCGETCKAFATYDGPMAEAVLAHAATPRATAPAAPPAAPPAKPPAPAAAPKSAPARQKFSRTEAPVRETSADPKPVPSTGATPRPGAGTPPAGPPAVDPAHHFVGADKKVELAPGVTVELVEVTPELATKWLEGNVHNRKLSQARVDSLVRDIKAGAWKMNGDSVKFASDGTMLDGQHRCWSVTLAEVPVKMLVVRGVEKSARSTMDRHRPRNDADELKLLGHEVGDPKRAVAIVKALRLIVEGRARLLTFNEVSGYLAEHEQAIEWALGACSTKQLRFAPVAGALTIAYPKDPANVNYFAEALRSGANLKPNSPALAVREYILDRDRLRADTRRNVSLRVLRGIAAHLHGTTVDRLRTADDKILEFFLPKVRSAA